MTMGSQTKSKTKPATIAKYKRVIDEWLVNGENGTKAYQKIYVNSSSENAKSAFARILTFPNIKKYITQQKKIKAKSAKKEYNVTFQSQVKDQVQKKEVYQEFLRLAMLDKPTKLEKEKFQRLRKVINISGVNKADDILNKMLGFESPIKTRESEIKTEEETAKEINHSELTTEELTARVKALQKLKGNE